MIKLNMKFTKILTNVEEKVVIYEEHIELKVMKKNRKQFYEILDKH